jgi:hypothetical protein
VALSAVFQCLSVTQAGCEVARLCACLRSVMGKAGKGDFFSPKQARVVARPALGLSPASGTCVKRAASTPVLTNTASAPQIANRQKAKGLQKLRWYCQMCNKQCRDENGFKCHQTSESHKRQMLVFGQAPEHGARRRGPERRCCAACLLPALRLHTKSTMLTRGWCCAVIDGFSESFLHEFLEHLRRSHPHSRVAAKIVYNEYIANRHHVHMNSTKWLTLTGAERARVCTARRLYAGPWQRGAARAAPWALLSTRACRACADFVKYLGREGLCKVDETEKGWYMSIIQRDPAEELAAERRAKRERAEAVSLPPAPAGAPRAARRCGAAPTARAVACARPIRRPRPRPGRCTSGTGRQLSCAGGTDPRPAPRCSALMWRAASARTFGRCEEARPAPR